MVLGDSDDEDVVMPLPAKRVRDYQSELLDDADDDETVCIKFTSMPAAKKQAGAPAGAVRVFPSHPLQQFVNPAPTNRVAANAPASVAPDDTSDSPTPLPRPASLHSAKSPSIAPPPAQRPGLPQSSGMAALRPPPLSSTGVAPPPPPLLPPALAPPPLPSGLAAPQLPPPLLSPALAPPPPRMAPGAPPAPPAPPPPAPPPAPPPPGQAGEPSGPKLKPLVWQKVPKNRLKGTVWQAVKEGTMGEPSFDMQRFESLFVAKEPVKPTAMVRGSSSSVVGGAQASLLDPKRSNHFGIILKQVKVTLEEMRRAVVALDEKILTPDAVAALQKCVPLPEEIELVSAADPAALGYAEKFVLQVGSVPRLQQRLETFAFKRQFSQALLASYDDVNVLTHAASELCACEQLHQLLGLLLNLGNSLNQGSFRAGAEGFRLECLPRLAELKTNDHRSSLLQYALAVQGGQEPDATKGPADFLPAQPPLTSFAEKCKSVRAAAKLSLENVNEEVARLKSGLTKIEAELEHFREQARVAQVDAKAKAKASVEGGVAVLSAREEALARDQYLQVMGSFRDGATAQVEELGCAALRMEEMHKVLRSFFAEESKTSIEEIFSRWATFLGQVDAAVAHHNEDRAKAAKVK